MGTDRRKRRLQEVLRNRQPDLTVVMENVHDPHNVSAILRSCDAAGVMQVQLVYTEEKFPRLGRKSSASAAKWVARRQFQSLAECFETLRAEGFTILATRIRDSSKSLYSLDLTRKVALVFGNEHRGVSDECAKAADGHFAIPMFGMVQSLNVSVACAVALYEAVRQRIGRGHYETPKLGANSLVRLLQQWERKQR